MKRSAVFTVAVIAALLTPPLVAVARDAKMLRVGAVKVRPFGKANISLAFLERMMELGYEQGRNFNFEFVRIPNRASYGRAYRELVARKADILAAGGPEIALESAVAAAGELPIVMIAVDDEPLARGYVPSLARPGGGLRGQNSQGSEARGPASRTADQVRVGGEPEDRQGARRHDPAFDLAAGDEGDRMTPERYFSCVSAPSRMSLNG